MISSNSAKHLPNLLNKGRNIDPAVVGRSGGGRVCRCSGGREEEEPAQDQKPPPEMEEEFVEDQYQFASSSWLQVHLDQDDVGDDKEEENVAVNSDSHSQATALILGEHLRERER